MKKKISLYLALILMFNMIMPAALLVETKAAPVGAELDLALSAPSEFNQFLALGTGKTAPNIVNGTAPLDEVLLWWDLGGLPTGTAGLDIVGTKYVLRYYKSDNKKVELTVQKNSTNLMVNYDVYDGKSGVYRNINKNSATVDGSFSYNANGYEVHTPLNTADFVPIQRFFSPLNYNGGAYDPVLDEDLNNRVNNRKDPSSNNDEILTGNSLYNLSPSFNITSNNGYSFKFNGMTVHFYWESATNRFYFGTNGIDQGRIYDFELEYYLPDESAIYDPTNHSTTTPSALATCYGLRQIFTGIDASTFRVMPYANDNNTLERFFDRDGKNMYTDNPYKEYNFDPLKMPALLPDGETAQKPAHQSVGLDIRFDVPKSYDEVKGSFTQIPDFEVPVVLELVHKNGKHSVTTVIDDVTSLRDYKFGAPIDPVDINKYARLETTPDSTVQLTDISRLRRTTLKADQEADRVRVKLDNMKAGLIFDSAQISVRPPSDNTHLTTRPTDLSAQYGSVYTFPDYDVVAMNGRLYLSVKPFGMDENARHRGWYQLSSGQVLLESFRTESTGDALVMFPLTAGTQDMTTRFYQVRFSRTGNFVDDDTKSGILFSQVIQYTPEPVAASVGSPDNFMIMKGRDDETNADREYKLTPLEDSPDGSQASLSFWTRWDVGQVDMIRQLVNDSATSTAAITYELNKSLTPDAKDPSLTLFDRVILEVYPNPSDGKLMVEYISTTGDGDRIVNTGPQTLRMRVDNTVTPPVTLYYAEIHYETDAAREKYPLLPEPDFRYPGIYFMNVKPTLLKQDGEPKSIEYLSGSQFDYMTLNDFSTLSVPPPSNLNAVPVTTANGYQEDRPAIDVSFRIPGGGIRKYLDSMYPYPNPEVTANLYIGQNEKAIKDTFYPGSGGESVNRAKRLLTSLGIDYDESYGRDLNLSNINGGGSAMAMPADKNYADAREALRKGEVVRISDITLTSGQALSVLNGESPSLSFTMDGLDRNQKYYIFVDLVVTHRDTLTGEPLVIGDKTFIQESMLTGMVGVTTADVENKPSSSEETPPAPMNLGVDRDSISQGTATIFWDRVPSNDGATIEYEIIRLKDSRMDEKIFSSTDPFGDCFDNLDNANKVGWRTSGLRGVELYNGRSFAPVQDNNLYEYNATGNPILFTDSSLSPNQIYFYYVRTVRFVRIQNEWMDTTIPIVSTWSQVSLTTKPVQSPGNLKVENGRTDYDRETEIVVSFDVPFLDPNTQIGTDYLLQYQLKKDDGEWSNPITMEKSQLTDPKNYTVSSDGKTIRFIYKIKGLEPGTMYSLRVRLYDVKADDGSLYTNVVRFMTDINQEDYDDAIKQGEWLDFLQKQLQKLVTDPYWLAAESTKELTVVYRPGELFNGLLYSTPDGAMTLYNNGANVATYYFPVSAIVMANDANKGFRVQYDDMSLQLSPRAVDTTRNDAIAQMSDYLKNREIADYFIRLTINRSLTNGMIEGETVLGRQTQVDIEAVGVILSAGDIKKWDDDLYRQFAQMLDDEINDPELRADLQDQIKSGTISEEMIEYIDRIAEDIKSEMMEEVNSQVRDTRSGILSKDKVTDVTKLDAPMHLSVKTAVDSATYVNAYQWMNTGWVPKEVVERVDGKGITVSNTGTFAFTGRTVSIPGSESVKDGGVMTNLTAKYGLDEYLGRNGAVDMTQNATRLMVAGCIARMAGAPKTADPITWVQNNLNVTLSSRNASGNVQTQEAMAMVMALYEKKTNTQLASIAIRNYNTTANMTGLADPYKQAVRAAFEVGIVNDTNLRPTGSVTVGALLDMLAALDNKVKL